MRAGSAEAWTAATDETVGRKLREARLALALEDTYSKDELLTRYLNIVYFGQNAYGVQPAARAFFGVDAAALTLPQAALLAGLVQSPADDDPFTNPEGATIRRNQVLARMAAQGYITPAQEAEATAAPLGLAPGPAAAPRLRPGQRRRLRLRLRAEVRDAEARAQPAGARARTARSSRPRWTPSCSAPATPPSSTPCRSGDSRGGTFTAVQPGTGHLLAMSVNRIFGYDLNDPTQESYNLNEAPSRGAGSTYKVFVAAAALARGYSTDVHADDVRPVPLPRLQEGRRALPGPERRHATGRRWTSRPRSTSPPTPTSWRWRTPSAASRSRCAWPRRWGSTSSGQEDLPQTIIDENRGSFTFGPDATSPLGPGQRLLDAGRQRHAVRRPPGDGGPRPAPASRLLGDDGEPLPIGRNVHARGHPAGRREHAEPDAAQGRRAGEPRADRPARLRPRVPDRRQDRDDAEQRTRWPSSATPRRSPPASWSSTPRRTRTSAASAAARARPSGATPWRRS